MLSVMSHEKLSPRECVRTEEETWRESKTLLGGRGKEIVIIKKGEVQERLILGF